MRVLISIFVVFIVFQSINATVEERALKSATLFFKKFLNLFVDVVHELETKISELKEEVRYLKANASETSITVENVQSQVSSNAEGLEGLQTRESIVQETVEELQANVSENSLNIRNLEIMNSETDSKILNLTIAVSRNTVGVLNLQSNTSASTKEIGTSKPKSCLEVQTQNKVSKSGVYMIFPNPAQVDGIEVYCDLETKGGGWTVFQSRSDKGTRVDFYRDWVDYKKGFGTAATEFWIGLQNLAALTSSDDQELRIELTDWDSQSRVANYSEFRIGNDFEKYALHIGKYSGDAGDSLDIHDGSPFTTKDQDNDKFSSNCANLYRGAWWYGSGCGFSNLNGDPTRNGTEEGIWWYHWRGHKYSLKTVQMKLRTRNIL